MNDRLIAQVAAASGGAVPEGEHLVRLTEARVVKRKKGGFSLRILSETVDGGATLREMRRLSDSDEDAFELSVGKRRGMLDFARRLNLSSEDPREIVEELQDRVGAELSALVKRTPHATIVKHHAPKGIRISTVAGTLTTAGEIVGPDDAHKLYELLRDGLNATRIASAVVARACYMISRDHAYESLGYSTLASFLAQPELGMSRTEFFRMASIYERYVLEGGVEEAELAAASPSKLEIPLRALAAGEVEAAEAVGDAKELGISDLRRKYRKSDEADEESRIRECPRCAGIPDEPLDELRLKWGSMS